MQVGYHVVKKVGTTYGPSLKIAPRKEAFELAQILADNFPLNAYAVLHVHQISAPKRASRHALAIKRI